MPLQRTCHRYDVNALRLAGALTRSAGAKALTFSPQALCIRHGWRYITVRRSGVLNRAEKAQLLSRPVGWGRHSKPARRAGSMVCQARQGGGLHVRCSFRGARARVAAAANAQPAALCVVTWVQAGLKNHVTKKLSMT